MSIEKGPSEAEQINMQSEAEDTNKMVDEGLLMPEEAMEFNYDNEIKIPDALLSQPPILSERLSNFIISKFPPDSFLPENIAGTVVHGTSIRAIRPMWLDEGTRTHQGVTLNTDYSSTNDSSNTSPIFKIKGDLTKLGEDGFNHINDEGDRDPGSVTVPGMPIFLVLGTIDHKTREDEIMGKGRKDELRQAKYLRSVVLTKTDRNSTKVQIAKSQNCLNILDDPTRNVNDIDNKLSWNVNLELGHILSAQADRFSFPTELDEQRQLTEKFSKYLSKKIEEYSKESYYMAEKWKKELEEELPNINDFLQKGEFEKITASEWFNRFIYDYTKSSSLTKTLAITLLSKTISDGEKIIERNHGKDVYNVQPTRRGETLGLTLEQEANYIAHCMVQGVDKSKIVPIYDWDGNLLWPTEEDVIKSEEKVEE